MTPMITRRRRQLTSFVCVVMGLYVLFYVGVSLYPEWTKHVLGVDMFTLTDPDSMLRYSIPVVALVLVLAPRMVFRLWVRREKKAVAQGKRPCLHCGYDLQGHESMGTCSECGTPFDVAEIERYFRNLSDSGKEDISPTRAYSWGKWLIRRGVSGRVAHLVSRWARR